MAENKVNSQNENSVKNNKGGTLSKVLSVLTTVITAIIFLITLLVVINAVVAKVQNRPVNFFGYSFAIVVTQSMEPEIMTGDLIVVKSCDISQIEVNDDVVFVAGSSFGSIEGQSVVHRVIEIDDLGLVTKGINNLDRDSEHVTADNLLGICIYNSSVLGGIVTFFIRFGLLIIVLLIGLPFIVKQVIKLVKLVKEEKSKEDKEENNKN